MSRRATFTDIDTKSRDNVHDRDSYRCVYCGRTDKMIELAHYINRALGGLGVPQNLISLCVDCHREYDGTGRHEMRGFLKKYLQTIYRDWDESKLIYRKGYSDESDGN